jgi:hypothetical protein
MGAVLVDGFTTARWRMDRQKDTATLRVEPFRRLDRLGRAELAEEGEGLVRFLAADAKNHALKIESVP